MEIILYQPEIPPNTGNVARLCAATGTPLHLIEPLGFSLEDRYLKRAGLDYWPSVDLRVWPDWERFANDWPGLRLVFTSARRGLPLHHFQFRPGDGLVFGPETRGCPPWLLDRYPDRLVNIPIWGPVRSLNLSTAAGVVLYEALRQTGALDRDLEKNEPGQGNPGSDQGKQVRARGVAHKEGLY
ncbi:MAG: tRNA (cytidine(34)-2'-O)-methyltransferase [Proteobacteria bacterium]|nr:tRNA (cytidine(34)-2'-O)-methyltransferase [Pseudomonadota bacterium]